MNTTSPRRRQVLDFILTYLGAEGHSPSLNEIAAGCGLKSRSAAQKHVRALETSGELEVTPGKARSARPRQRKTAAPGLAPLFEVSIQDVEALTDGDLRELVARLCMAELANADLSCDSVTWGGDQRAPDGGIDVRIQLPADSLPIARFPRRTTGFQVKATKMRAGDIQREMCPSGLLRPSIQELIQSNGSYIIATSDSAADEEYKKRIAAMSAAAATEAGYEQADLHYYDARSLADWTNNHPGVVVWMRSRLGRPLQAWQPHGQWADTRGGKPHPFFPDEKLRLADPHEPERKLPLAEGLVHVRNVLRTAGNSIRLTGLSGVGKTRFAQALFEADAAPNPLPSDLVVYTDMSRSPNPPPLALLDELLASRRRAILVIDNCSSELHNQLTTRCKASSRVSLLTIEYDIREGLPNETSVFHLDTGSAELIENVIRQQFPHISQVNVTTITKFADGNSRVAIALADTMRRNESLAGLSEGELFNRLFWLGKEIQHALMVAAQACSLVYSFDGEDLDGELAQLAALTDESVTALYRHVNELERRGLAQRRGVWRAVLPHAIANTLAIRALDSIPYALIERHLVRGQDRLLRSFSRRLGYLHDSPKAVAIVRKWLSPDDFLGNAAELTAQLVQVLINVAPVDPEAVLKSIESVVRGPDAGKMLDPENASRTHLVRLVRSIAYESKYFERCLDVLVAFALAEPADIRLDATRDVIKSLFTLYLSGTHATTEQRANWVKQALESGSQEIQSIGRLCLSSALECQHFSSSHTFEFGARSRDYGWLPQGRETQNWFATFINLAVDVGSGTTEGATAVRDLLARDFRPLWTIAGMADSLEAATSPLLDNGWEKGWLAIRQTIGFDRERLPSAILSRLKNLEERARPKTLLGRVKAIVLNGHSAGLDFADGEPTSTSYERADERARELGELVSKDAATLDLVTPQVVRNEQGRQWMFGEGLAKGAESINHCWDKLVLAFESTPEEERNVQVLRGFLSGVFKRERAAFERLLDGAMDRASIAMWVPVLQLSAPLDDKSCARLLISMDNANVPAWVFQYLGWGRSTANLTDDTLAYLLKRLSIKPGGPEIAVDVLSMHISSNPNSVDPGIRRLARSLLGSVPLIRNNQRLDYELKRLVEFSIRGLEGESAARELLMRIRKGLEDYSISAYDLNETLASLFELQPMAALEILVGDDADEGTTYVRRRALAGGRRSSALSGLAIEALVAWCEKGAEERWRNVAPLLPAFDRGADDAGLRWSNKVLTLLRRSPRRIDIANALVDLILPMSWSGSRAEAIRLRFPLLDELAQELGAEHACEIAEWKSRITKIIDRETKRELDERRARDERFE